jgi:hypothetical protein
MIKLEYFPEKRGKSHDFVTFVLANDRIKLLRGVNEIAENQLEALEKVDYFQQFIEQGVIVLHKDAPKSSTKKTTKPPEKPTEIKE